MAVFTVSNAGGNYNIGTTWVGNVVPSTTDTVAFTATSGNLTISNPNTCAGIDFTNYLGTITFNFTLTSNGPVNFGTAGYNVSGSSTLNIVTTTTITSNGSAWKGNLTFGGTSQTYTLADAMVVNGTVSIASTTGIGINGFSLTFKGSFTQTGNAAVSGTTSFIFNGTGTWSNASSGAIGIPITINTAGTLTVSGTVRLQGSTLTYTAGTVTTTGSTLLIRGGLTLNTSTVSWDNLTFSGTTNTYTLLSDFNMVGTLTSAAGQTMTINGLFNINIAGSMNITGNLQGTASIILTGTGTIGGVGILKNNLTINTAGTITQSSNVFYNTGTFKYIAGTFNQSVYSMQVNGSTTFDTSGMTFATINLQAGTHTLLSDMYVSNIFLGTTGNSIISGFTLYVSGNFTVVNNATVSGSPIIFTGNTIWSCNGTGVVQNNVTITGTVNIIGPWWYYAGSFVNSGTLFAESSSLTIAFTGTTTFDFNGAKLGGITVGGGSTVNIISLTSTLYILNGVCSLGFGSQVQTINGASIYIESGTLTSGINNFATVQGTSQIFMIGDKAAILDSSTTNVNGSSIWTIPITLDIRGTCIMSGILRLASNFTILNGIINNRASIRNQPGLVISASITLTNIDKCKFKNITINVGLTVTMNDFFLGSPEYSSVIRSNGTTNYTITFTDSTPKKSFFVNIKNATITNRNQLNIINRYGDAGSNQGIIFGELSRDGFPINQFPTERSYTMQNGLLSDIN